MKSRHLFWLGFAAAVLSGFGCGGGGGSPPPAAALGCTDGGAADENAIAMACGAATDNTTERVDVVLGGPTSGTTTLRGVNFDVIYDPSKLDYVPAATDTSPLFSPNALIAVSLYNGLPGRLVVSIQEYGGLADVTVGAGQHTVMSLSFRRTSGVNFSPTPLTFENAEASTASAAIGFGSALALSYQ
jgi:hypothetical protein